MRDEYIEKINHLLEGCYDMALIDLVYQLLREG